MRRRTFLFAAAAALGAPAKRVRIGAHLWVCAATQPCYDPTFVLDQVFLELSSAGLDGLELMHQTLIHEDSVERIGKLSREHKLPITGTSWSGNLWDRGKRDADLESIRTIVPRLAKLGGRTLGISVGDARRDKTEEEFDLQAASLREIMKICAGHGVVPNLHNHVYEVRNGEHDLNGTLARIPEIKLGPDLAWLHRAKVDPVDFIRRRGKQMVFAHLRNDTAGSTWPEDITEGVMNYKAIGKALRDVGFTGDLVIELAHERGFVPTRSLGESFRISREYVRSVMGY
jgi:sugar phosphate isomerase/epimerase